MPLEYLSCQLYFYKMRSKVSICLIWPSLSCFSIWESCCPSGAGAGDVGVIIVDSNGRRDTVEIVLENKGDSIFRCTYVPVLEGPHTVYVTFAGQQIPRSPFTVHISEGRCATFMSTTVDTVSSTLYVTHYIYLKPFKKLNQSQKFPMNEFPGNNEMILKCHKDILYSFTNMIIMNLLNFPFVTTIISTYFQSEWMSHWTLIQTDRLKN